MADYNKLINLKREDAVKALENEGWSLTQWLEMEDTLTEEMGEQDYYAIRNAWVTMSDARLNQAVDKAQDAPESSPETEADITITDGIDLKIDLSKAKVSFTLPDTIGFKHKATSFGMLPLRTEGELQPLMLSPGLTVVMGRTGAGKTSFITDDLLPAIQASRRDAKVHKYLLAEPIVDGWTELFSLTTLSAQLEHHLKRTPDDLVIVDSLRLMYFSSSGSTGSFGVNNLFAPTLNQLNNAVAMSGSHVIVTVNPGALPKEGYNALVADLSASVNNFFDLGENVGMSRDGTYNDPSNTSIQYYYRGPLVKRGSTTIVRRDSGIFKEVDQNTIVEELSEVDFEAIFTSEAAYDRASIFDLAISNKVNKNLG